MLFNSYIFCLVLLPVALLGWYKLKPQKGKMALVWLLGASMIFYGYSSLGNLCLLIVSMIGNYGIAYLMERRKQWKKFLLLFGLCLDVGVLFYFKYLGFVLETADYFVKLPNAVNVFKQVALPLGISFYTFQQISYLIDVFYGESEAYSLLEYSLFISFFAQLIAGPIALHDEVILQLREKRSGVDWKWIGDGVYAFSVGMAKKVLIADKLSQLVGVGYSDVEALSSVDAWIVMLAYTFQIYFDFSGYCDMAWGIGKLFHIELPINFYSPYRATSITEFWERWHITLTRFFRKYVYIPLGGNRKGKYRQYVNIMIVFLLSGIWHGANWTFIFWGGVYGILNVGSRMLRKTREKLPKWLNWIGTFLSVNVLWVLFRADSLKQAFQIYGKLFGTAGMTISKTLYDMVYIAGSRRAVQFLFDIFNWQMDAYMVACVLTLGVILVCALLLATIAPNVYEVKQRQTYGKLLFCVMCLVCSVLSFSGVSEFLYFNF